MKAVEGLTNPVVEILVAQEPERADVPFPATKEWADAIGLPLCIVGLLKAFLKYLKKR